MEAGIQNGVSMKFGLLVPQGWRMDLVGIADPIEAYETMTRVAQEAEAVGFDSIWLFDHFHTVPTPAQEVTFECWTSTAALARDTRRVRIGQMVSCNGYRNPALLAKMASTGDVLSHGRLDFGIGAGCDEQVTLKLVAQYGDACNIGHLDLEGLERKFAIIKKHCEDVGRDYNTIRRTVLFNCAIAETDEAALAKSVSFARN